MLYFINRIDWRILLSIGILPHNMYYVVNLLAGIKWAHSGIQPLCALGLCHAQNAQVPFWNTGTVLPSRQWARISKSGVPIMKSS